MPFKPIEKYFPHLSAEQHARFVALDTLYRSANARVNLISRQDIDHLYTHHVLHSLSIGQVAPFAPHSQVLDIGTGGGFPGIPLAILFPQSSFLLVDSIGKKIAMVQEIVGQLKLQNVRVKNARVELLLAERNRYDFVVSRAVASLAKMWTWVHPLLKNKKDGGLLCLKGGELANELAELNQPYRVYLLKDYLAEPFFETKKLVWISQNSALQPSQLGKAGT